MIRPLAQPVTVNVLGTKITLDAAEHTYDVRRGHILSRVQYGKINAAGVFESAVAVHAPEELAIAGEDYAWLMAPRGGKKQDRYRNEDVADMHDAIRLRRATEAANAAALAAQSEGGAA